MAYKNRSESEELIILGILDTRMTLEENDKKRLLRLKKGYEGEVIFDQLTERLRCECYIINDLNLKVNNTDFQIDTTIIVAGKIHFYEVKNFEGDYFYERGAELKADRLYKLPKTEYNNPLTQLHRGDSLLRQLLNELGVNLPIEAKVVFINPKFTLYQAPLDRPFIFPTQVANHLEKLNNSSLTLNVNHKKLADKLISLHIKKFPYTQLPPYKYDHLRKGNTCGICHSFSIIVKGKKFVCLDCGHEELIMDAVLRNVQEIRLLFPEMKITTNLVHEWVGVVDSKKMIRRILIKSFEKIADGPNAFYK